MHSFLIFSKEQTKEQIKGDSRVFSRVIEKRSQACLGILVFTQNCDIIAVFT